MWVEWRNFKLKSLSKNTSSRNNIEVHYEETQLRKPEMTGSQINLQGGEANRGLKNVPLVIANPLSQFGRTECLR